jgi:sarcosine oxidase, subunit alpha
MAQGTTAGISIAKHARKGSTDINEKLQQAMKNVHTVRQNAAIQFNPELANGRRKIYELWDNLYGNEQDTIQKIR